MRTKEMWNVTSFPMKTYGRIYCDKRPKIKFGEKNSEAAVVRIFLTTRRVKNKLFGPPKANQTHTHTRTLSEASCVNKITEAVSGRASRHHLISLLVYGRATK